MLGFLVAPTHEQRVHSPFCTPTCARPLVHAHPTPPHPTRSQAVRGKPMSKDEVELLYRVFDTNKDGFLEVRTEMEPARGLVHCWMVVATHAAMLSSCGRQGGGSVQAVRTCCLLPPSPALQLSEMVRIEEHIDDEFAHSQLY